MQLLRIMKTRHRLLCELHFIHLSSDVNYVEGRVHEIMNSSFNFQTSILKQLSSSYRS